MLTGPLAIGIGGDMKDSVGGGRLGGHTRIALTVLAVTSAVVLWRENRRRRRRERRHPTIHSVISKIEQVVQRDEGKRGIADLIIPGELEAGAIDLYKAKKVAILTGFPCMLDCRPPTETDGPPGAVAIARACLALNKQVYLLIDETNHVVLEAAISADPSLASNSLLQFESFPCRWSTQAENRLKEIAKDIDLVITIERAGPAEDGHYYTMRARTMDHLLAPLERILESIPDSAVSIGIGDGGNEIGMGKVRDKVLASRSIPNARKIACVTPTTHLVVASVSNWGGYALAAALALIAASAPSDEEDEPVTPISFPGGRNKCISQLLVSDTQERVVLREMIAAGARDGITGEKELMVDGMSLEASIQILREIRRLTSLVDEVI